MFLLPPETCIQDQLLKDLLSDSDLSDTFSLGCQSISSLEDEQALSAGELNELQELLGN